MVKKTRKSGSAHSITASQTLRGGKKGILSIPELRHAFEHIESFGRKCAASVHAKKTTKASAAASYAKEWKKTFGRSLPTKSAMASIEHYMSLSPGGKQRGGMAPVSGSELQPGIYAAPTLPGQTDGAGYTAHGSFLPYVEKGFSVGIPQDGLASMCGKQDSFPMPAANLGSNAVTPMGATPVGSTTYMKGGRRTRRRGLRRSQRGSGSNEIRAQTLRGGSASLAAAFRPMLSSNPPGVGHDAQMMFKSAALPASPDPTQPAFNYKANDVMVPNFDGLGVIDRNLNKEIVVGKN